LNLILRATEMVAFSFVYSFIYRFNQNIAQSRMKRSRVLARALCIVLP